MTSFERLEMLFQALNTTEITEVSKKINQLSDNDEVFKRVKILFNFLRTTNSTTINSNLIFLELYAPIEEYTNSKEDQDRLKEDKKRLSDVYWRLRRIIEDTIVMQAIKADDFQYRHLLENVLHQRNIKDLGQEKIQQSLKAFGVSENKRLEAQKRHFDTHLLNFNFVVENNRVLSEKQEKKLNVNLSAATHLLDTYLIATALRHACLLLSHRKLNKSDNELKLEKKIDDFEDLKFYEQIVDFLDKAEPQFLEKNPLVNLYYLGYKLKRETENEPYFEGLKKLEKEHFDDFDKENLLELNTYLINWYIGKINARLEREQSLLDLFNLFKRIIANKVIFENGKIQVAYFKHITVLAIALNELEWLNDFLDHHKDKIRVNSSEQWKYYNFFKAKLFYAKNEYEQASQLIEGITLEDSLSEMNLRILQFKLTFEQATNTREYLYALNYYLKNYIERLKKINLSKDHKDRYKVFFSLAKRLCLYAMNPKNSSRRKALERTLSKSKPIEQKWFQKQLNRLK